MAALLIDAEKCKKCGMCVAECPIGIIQFMAEDSPPSWLDGAEALCINCGHCVAICPNAALELSAMSREKCLPIAKDLVSTPEQLEQFLKSRRSIRAYKENPVEHEKLAKLIDIARYAPSGHNLQPVQWLVIQKREDVKHLAQLTVDWLKGLVQKEPAIAEMLQAEALANYWDMGIDVITRWAPHLIITHVPKNSAFSLDCHIAMTYLELAAHSMGLGAFWAGFVQVAAASDPAFAQVMQLPENHVCYGAMMIGYPKYKYSCIPMKKAAQILWH